MAHKLQGDEDKRWGGSFTMYQVFGYTEDAEDWEAVFHQRHHGNIFYESRWDTEVDVMNFQLHHRLGNYQFFAHIDPPEQSIASILGNGEKEFLKS